MILSMMHKHANMSEEQLYYVEADDDHERYIQSSKISSVSNNSSCICISGATLLLGMQKLSHLPPLAGQTMCLCLAASKTNSGERAVTQNTALPRLTLVSPISKRPSSSMLILGLLSSCWDWEVTACMS